MDLTNDEWTLVLAGLFELRITYLEDQDRCDAAGQAQIPSSWRRDKPAFGGRSSGQSDVVVGQRSLSPESLPCRMAVHSMLRCAATTTKDANRRGSRRCRVSSSSVPRSCCAECSRILRRGSSTSVVE